ncbi:hypothetical protein [Candidatus Nanohalococcus occultus]|uniref:Uncharacterized protein n=1 Tax=Candidatus Nanohalococcus occultus TaxID=2978047 RepID=A0ABY8CET6_9ARCH|nr:hypothetical protein SVXNc_0715 [Candidatus Nanohaloarchaeota archaeon SVXNc]
MAYRATQRFEDPNEALNTLEKLEGHSSYTVHGKYLPIEESVLNSEHNLEKAVEQAYTQADQLKVTINYDVGSVKISGSLGILPVSSMKGDFEPGSWQDFKSFLEENGDWK